MHHPKISFFINEITRNIYVWGAILLSASLLLAAIYWPFMANILKVAQPGLNGWMLVLTASLIPLLIGQAYIKFIKSKFFNQD